MFQRPVPLANVHLGAGAVGDSVDDTSSSSLLSSTFETPWLIEHTHGQVSGLQVTSPLGTQGGSGPGSVQPG